ncbi:phage tail terminator protein [Rhizobium sp. 11_C7_N12_5]|uniref:phage tail terminator protein n=1 Tax=Rhizobium sp. 11_C7_N12_5 TaxID=3240770 RepID=UPI003F241509
MLNLFRDRLADKAEALTSVEILENLEALANMSAPETGAAFVIPFRERAGKNQLMGGGFRQNVTVQVMVAFVVRNDDDASGAKRISQFDTYKLDIQQALAGWVPASGSVPCELVSGEATPLDDSAVVYVQAFETTYFLTGTSS